ncbi:MAG: PilZ domain-containing protein [Magnetococcales bacterium]|nr:PilZ domain-containing protein [Magnetococcales bacterium]
MFDFLTKFGERRKEPRAPVQRQVRFVSDSGIVCTGSCKNISAEALLLVSEQRNHVDVNEVGQLIVDYKGVTSTFPGRVTRSGKYSVSSYCVAIQYVSPEAVAFFTPMVVNGTSCHNCGSTDNLERCPKCNGIQTVCATCLQRDHMCRTCRSENYFQQQRDR